MTDVTSEATVFSKMARRASLSLVLRKRRLSMTRDSVTRDSVPCESMSRDSVPRNSMTRDYVSTALSGNHICMDAMSSTCSLADDGR